MGMNVVAHKHNPSGSKTGLTSLAQELLTQGQSHNRNIAAAATTWAAATNTVTWNAGFGVSEVTISSNLAGTASVTGCLVVFDAPNDAAASAWLADAGSATTDVQYVFIPNGQTRTFQLTSQIVRLDVLALGAAHRILVEAA